ncbi:hypothetical protein LOAG_05427 [Loa loa]|uniref:Uncharacterized protein n=1 Tax=Loa loa TaxID=7209 RepID=A0A1S0U1N8_LOALO|nr:hypothetical protein LOAG_05427 [Loa loa]EFO23061.1 hypothetical protein LOAG_05427 [Loa loa]
MSKKQANSSSLLRSSAEYYDDCHGMITGRDVKRAKVKMNMEEVKRVIIALKMNNRVDDLNRDWQERLQKENVKWKNNKHSSNKYCKNRVTGSQSSQDVSNMMWRTERRLLELTDRLAPIQKMEQKLEEIIEVLKRNPCYQPTSAITDNLHISESENANTTENMQKDGVAKAPNFYGVVEITENYSMVIFYSILKREFLLGTGRCLKVKSGQEF